MRKLLVASIVSVFALQASIAFAQSTTGATPGATAHPRNTHTTHTPVAPHSGSSTGHTHAPGNAAGGATTPSTTH